MRHRLLGGGSTLPQDLVSGVTGELWVIATSIESVSAAKTPPSEWTASGLPAGPQQRIRPHDAGNPDPSQGEPTCPGTIEPVLHAAPDREQPAGEVNCTAPNGGSHMGAKHGRRKARKVWACAGCGIKAEALVGGKLRECTGCRSVRYCGKECQLKHWPLHKAPCKGLQAARG
jgi:hypothetical protein